MSLIELSVKHGCTVDEARERLEKTVQEVTQRFGRLVDRVEWSPDRTAVKIAGSGLTGDVSVDHELVHVRVDLPALLGMFSQQVVGNLKAILQHNFPKQLPAK
jgi:putative polyhydroxyalkanoate system protein